MQIPVFHDDQHGTAIISGAALMNGAELSGKKLADMKVVVSGAGASAIACANFYVELGVRLENVTLVDSMGVIYAGRGEGMNPYKAKFARKDDGARTRADAIRGADVFLGLSKAGLCTAEMLKTMAKKPLIFALANPDPEISYSDAKAAAPRRDRGDRAQRLPQPGQQRARVPLHLPGRAGRARRRTSTNR
jgi:malate dehydrogenase (oxaloacetate-decarboxylating)(NADP+)